MEDDPRRLPVYFLLDTSESMASEVFVAVTEAMAAIVGQMKQDPMALETASLSVITFDRTASRLVMPTDLAQFHQPKLKRGPGRALGEALHLCLDCIRREVRRPTPKRRGDWEPICFLLIGGEPTDNWHEIARELHFGGYETTIRSAVLVVVCLRTSGKRKHLQGSHRPITSSRTLAERGCRRFMEGRLR